MNLSWGKGYLCSLKVSSRKLFFTKRKKSNFTIEKPGEHHVNQEIKVNIANIGKYGIVIFDMMHWEGYNSSPVPLLTNNNKCNHEKTSNKHKLVGTLHCAFTFQKISRKRNTRKSGAWFHIKGDWWFMTIKYNAFNIGLLNWENN